jgi:hypothetical protein
MFESMYAGVQYNRDVFRSRRRGSQGTNYQPTSLEYMSTNFEVRVLLVLWDLGGTSVRKGELNSRFSGKAAHTKAAYTSLLQVGAIEISGNSLTLTDTGKILLAKSLAGGDFKFEAQIGAKTANSLLKWFQSQPTVVDSKLEVRETSIDSYEAFKSVTLETYRQLNRDFNLDDLVPIYRIRRNIGDRLKRHEFDNWLLTMQADDIFQLQGGSLPDGDAAKIEDSITTELSGLRCYATLLTV